MEFLKKSTQPWRVKAVLFALHLFLSSMISIAHFGGQSSEAWRIHIIVKLVNKFEFFCFARKLKFPDKVPFFRLLKTFS